MSKKVLLISAAVLLTLGLAGGLLFLGLRDSGNDVTNSQSIDDLRGEQPAADPNPSNATKEDETNQNSDSEDQAPTKEDTPKPTQSTSKKVQIKSIAQGTNGNVVVQVQIDQIYSGDCTLSLTQGGKTVTKEAEVIYATEYSTCSGFEVKKSELGSGTWQATVTVTKNGTEYKSSSSEVVVK